MSGITVRYLPVRDDLTLRVIESGPARDDAVLLVHGWGACLYSFAEMIPALASAGFRAIAFDLPGHGLSDKPIDEATYSTRSLSDVVLAVATLLGLRRFSLVAHSMGGALALEIAARGEPRLDSLTLISSVGLGRIPIVAPLKLFSPRLVNAFTPRLMTRELVSVILRLAYASPHRPTQRDIDEYWAPSQFDEYAWACRACAHRATWMRVSENVLRGIRVPVLVVAGERDRLVLGSAERAKLIPGARIVSIREGGHVVLQDCAGQTNEEVVQFLKRAHGSTKSLS